MGNFLQNKSCRIIEIALLSAYFASTVSYVFISILVAMNINVHAIYIM